MGLEIDLLAKYPRTRRNIEERASQKTESDRAIARQFGPDFFDGERRFGYGGFSYHPRFWESVVLDFQQRYDLKAGDSILDIGCAKGFMLYDFTRLIEGVQISGVDVSEYAIAHAYPDVQEHVSVADAQELPFESQTFDLVVSINTIHNLEKHEVVRALKEITRVSRRHAFVTVDAYRNEQEKEAMFAWNLTGKTILHIDEWKELFAACDYQGDYYWFMP